MAALATVPDLAMDYEISLRPELIVDTHAHEAWTAVDEVPRLAQHLQHVAAYHRGEKEGSHARS
jgi:hypothetical protein